MEQAPSTVNRWKGLSSMYFCQFTAVTASPFDGTYSFSFYLNSLQIKRSRHVQSIDVFKPLIHGY